jgi:ABC-type phosphate transport system substrate-binding protein
MMRHSPRVSQSVWAAGAIAALAVIALAPRAAGAQAGFVLIVHPANPMSVVARSDASKLFLEKLTRWPNGQKVQPVDEVESSPIRRRFSEAVHGMDVPSVKSFWQEIVFSGRGDPPPERVSDAEVIAYVRANPNAIGYVSSDTPVTGVRVVMLKP